MKSAALIVLVLDIFFVISSLQITPEEAKEAIQKAGQEIGKKLTATDALTKSFLNAPLAKLDELEKAGKESIDRIVTFLGPGDRDKAIQAAISFWKDKMEGVIKPFLENGEAYKVRVVYYVEPTYLSDQTYEINEENAKAEEELNHVMREEFTHLLDEYTTVTREKAKTAEDIPKNMWKKIAARWPLEETLKTMREEARATIQSSGFVDPQQATDRMEKVLVKLDDDFKKEMNLIEES